MQQSLIEAYYLVQAIDNGDIYAVFVGVGMVAVSAVGGKIHAKVGQASIELGGEAIEAGLKKIDNATGVCSFHGDTLVLTESGLLPIRDVTTAMSVASRDPATSAMSMKPVQAQYSNPYEETVSVTMRDVATGVEQTIISNRIHPYFVQTARAVVNSSEGHVYAGPIENGHWMNAAELQEGDRLLNDENTWAEVVGVEIEAEPLTAFIRHAVLAVQLGNSGTGCIFLKGRDNLLFGKP